MTNYRILAVKKMAGRSIPFEMSDYIAGEIARKYGCRIRDLVGKEVTLDEVETWEHLRSNMLRRDIDAVLNNRLFCVVSFGRNDFEERCMHLEYWDSWEKARLAKYIKTKQVKVSYMITDIQVAVERTRVITEFCGWKSAIIK